MTAQIGEATYFDVPAITERSGRLLDVATIVESEGTRWMDGVGLYQSYNCIGTDTVAIFPCPVTLLGAPVQAASSTATTGGTLAAGTYRAVVTAVNDRGETVVSNEISQVTTGAASTITWNWSNVVGETGYRIYVTAVGGAVGTETFLIALGANVVTYVWTGTPARGTALPPTSNTAVVSNTKLFETAGWQDGIRFAAYGGAVCKSVGYDSDDAVGQMQKVFLANESVAIERAIMQQRMVVNGTAWAAATDLTPAAGAPSAKVGLALLEGYAGWNYAGVPTIHAPRTIASLLTSGSSVELRGNALYSMLGSKVVAGSGYDQPNTGPTGAAPAVDTKWMFASGEVTVARSELVVGQEMNRVTNEIFTLVERFYIVAVDCFTAAVRVKVE